MYGHKYCTGSLWLFYGIWWRHHSDRTNKPTAGKNLPRVQNARGELATNNITKSFFWLTRGLINDYNCVVKWIKSTTVIIFYRVCRTTSSAYLTNPIGCPERPYLRCIHQYNKGTAGVLFVGHYHSCCKTIHIPWGNDEQMNIFRFILLQTVKIEYNS